MAGPPRLASPLVGARWLRSALAPPARSLKVLDASWHMPLLQRSGVKEFHERRIPSARFFDIDRVCDATSDLPHMLPTASEMVMALADLGIARGDTVVCYDASGIFAAPRLWWMCDALRVDGAAPVTPLVLDGGLPAWIASGGDVESGDVEDAPPDAGASLREVAHAATFDAARLADYGDVCGVVDAGGAASELIVDARSAGRFSGADPEPRPGLPSGHAPGSANVPFASLLVSNEHDGSTYTTLAEVPALRESFAEVSKSGKPVIFSCGTGVTACTLALATEVVKAHPDSGGAPVPSWRVYDGSWSEYAARAESRVDRG